MALNNVCCCCNYKVGIIIGGMLLMISSSLYYYIWIESPTYLYQLQGLRKAMLVSCFIVNISLIYGTVKEMKLFFVPWLVYEIIFMVLTFVHWCIAFAEYLPNVAIIIFIIPRYSLGIYYWVIIFRFWKLLDKKKNSVDQVFFSQSSSQPGRENPQGNSGGNSKENLSSTLAELSKNNKAALSNGYILVLPNSPFNNRETTYDYVANNLQHIYEFVKNKP